MLKKLTSVPQNLSIAMKHILFSLLYVSVCATVFAQPYAAKVDSLINAAVNDSKLPGAVLCVVVGDKVQYLQAYGYRQVYPDTLPMTVDTQFDMASLSKCIGTGMSLMTLVDRGLVDINDPISKYLPEYTPYKDANGKVGREQKVVDFLTHTSGLPAYASYTSLLKNEPSASPERRKQLLLQYMATCPRRAAAGTDFCYSCLNFITLQYLIEKVTGQTLDRYAEKYVFRPLGMRNTCYYPLGSHPKCGQKVAPTEKIAEEATDVAVPTILRLNYLAQTWGRPGKCYEGIVHDPLAREINAGVSGNAGVFSTAMDVSKMAIWMLNPEKKGPFSKQTLQLMLTVPEGYEEFGRVLAWDRSSDYSGCKGEQTSERVACHTGYTGTSVVIDEEKRVAVIVLTNRAHPSDGGGVSAMRRAVADAVFSQF